MRSACGERSPLRKFHKCIDERRQTANRRRMGPLCVRIRSAIALAAGQLTSREIDTKRLSAYRTVVSYSTRSARSRSSSLYRATSWAPSNRPLAMFALARVAASARTRLSGLLGASASDPRRRSRGRARRGSHRRDHRACSEPLHGVLETIAARSRVGCQQSVCSCSLGLLGEAPSDGADRVDIRA